MITYEKTIIGVIGVHLHNNPNSDRHKIEFTTKELNCITEHMKNHIDLQAKHEALRRDLYRQLKINRELRPYMETLQTEHEALKKDVARYFELESRIKEYDFVTVEDKQEYFRLHSKLSKVGKELEQMK